MPKGQPADGSKNRGNRTGRGGRPDPRAEAAAREENEGKRAERAAAIAARARVAWLRAHVPEHKRR